MARVVVSQMQGAGMSEEGPTSNALIYLSAASCGDLHQSVGCYNIAGQSVSLAIRQRARTWDALVSRGRALVRSVTDSRVGGRQSKQIASARGRAKPRKTESRAIKIAKQL